SSVGADPFLTTLKRKRQIAVRNREVVLPPILVLAGLEARATESRLRYAVVIAFAGLEAARPERCQPVPARDRVTRKRRDGPVVEAETAVEVRVRPAAEELRRQLLVIGEAKAHAAAAAFVAIAVAIGAVAEVSGIADGVKALALAYARLEREPPWAAAVRDAAARDAGSVRPVGRAGVGGEHAVAAAREYLDHAADRVGAVKARRGAAQNLDMVDLLERNRFERSRAIARRADAQAVDQHQRVPAVGAAQKDRARGAGPAVHGDLDSRHAGEQFGEALRSRARHVLGANDCYVGDETLERLWTPRCGDKNRGKGCLLGQGLGVRRVRENDVNQGEPRGIAAMG